VVNLHLIQPLSQSTRSYMVNMMKRSIGKKTMPLWPVLLYACFFNVTSSLSISETSKVRTNPIKRVGIVGAGIAGLSLAHALTNSLDHQNDFEVTIFDSRKSLDYTAGSGVQLNGGLAILGKINPDTQRSVMEAAIPIRNIRSNNKSWGDDSLDNLWDIDIEKMVKDKGGTTADELIVDGNVMWYGIMRGVLQKTLLETIPKNAAVEVNFDKTLTGIKSGTGGAVCEFRDGTSSESFDIIVGCDGIKSGVKEFVEKGKISDDASKREGNAAALYSGIRVGYAIQDLDALEDKKLPVTLEQVFADGAYAFSGIFGNGPNRPPCKGCFVISLDDAYNGPFRRKESAGRTAPSENADWSQDERKSKDETRRTMLDRLERFNVPGEDFVSMIENSDRFFELGVYFHNPISLSGWSKEISGSAGCFAVLCGDSAHAMPPFLGQGANQAIQDAYLLAQKICLFNSELQGSRIADMKPDLRALLKEYEYTRWKPTTSITAKAAILGYLETGGRDGFFSKFRDVFFKTLSIAGIPTRVLLDAATPKV